MNPDLAIRKAGELHPHPWIHRTMPDGRVFVLDAKGDEVGLFVLLDFACALSGKLTPKPTEATTETPT